ncbi:MAG: P1 family peptidase, partial [Acidobacteriota bacterium]
RQLKRLASRALAGMARTGASFSNGSGDYVIAFTTARSVRISHRASEAIEPARFLRDDRLSPLFQAVAEATQEAIYNSLLQATTVRGFRGREVRALPIHEVRRILSKHGGRSTSP